MRIEKVRKSKNKQAIQDIYTSAFPKEDRMPFPMMILMSCLWNTEFLAFYDEEVLCGFVYMATIKRQTFVMFIAVPETLRSKGYGSQILTQIQSLHPKNKIIISIEPCEEQAPDLNIRKKRKAFYLNNGYTETGYFLKLGGKEQEIIIKNGVFNKRAFQLFFMLYSNFTVIPKVWRIES